MSVVEPAPIDLDEMLGDPPVRMLPAGYCPECARSKARHWNPGGNRRWSCGEIREIEESCAYWAKPWWQRLGRRSWADVRSRAPICR